MKTKRKIIIITVEPMPNGLACTQRILNFSRGFIANGAEVTILALVPHDARYKNNKVHGVLDEIEYIYTCGTVNKSKIFLVRKWHRFKGLIIMLSKLIANRKNTDFIFLCGCNNLIPGILVALYSRLANIEIFHERTEMPYYNKPPKNISTRFYQFLYKKFFCRLFSGMIVISDRLKKFYHEQNVKHVLKVPIIFDTNEFRNQKRNNDKKYFLCSGALSQNQSGLIDLVKAFSFVAKTNPDVELILTGMPDRKDVEKCKKIITQAGIENRVLFKNYVTRKELLELMFSASCFVLPKPDNLQNRYCFASKLAEYMATGNPLITSKLGEICNYSDEDKNVFFVMPGSINELSDKMIYVLQNHEHADKVGSYSKKLAYSLFDNKLQALRIMDFTRKIKNVS